jgi:hypothetical protein
MYPQRNLESPVSLQRLIERCGSDFSRDKGLRRRLLVATEATPTIAGSPLWTKSPVIRGAQQ